MHRTWPGGSGEKMVIVGLAETISGDHPEHTVERAGETAELQEYRQGGRKTCQY